MLKTTKPYEDYFKNVVKPKVLKGEEDTLDNKWKRLAPTAYREIIKEQQDKIDKAVDEIQQLIDGVNNRTIIGLKNFIPKLEEIQDKLAGGDYSEQL